LRAKPSSLHPDFELGWGILPNVQSRGLEGAFSLESIYRRTRRPWSRQIQMWVATKTRHLRRQEAPGRLTGRSGSSWPRVPTLDAAASAYERRWHCSVSRPRTSISCENAGILDRLRGPRSVRSTRGKLSASVLDSERGELDRKHLCGPGKAELGRPARYVQPRSRRKLPATLGARPTRSRPHLECPDSAAGFFTAPGSRPDCSGVSPQIGLGDTESGLSSDSKSKHFGVLHASDVQRGLSPHLHAYQASS